MGIPTFYTRLSAEFYSYCKKYKEAIRNIIMAMHHLHKALKSSGIEGDHPELARHTFSSLYNDIKGYYELFRKQRCVPVLFKFTT